MAASIREEYVKSLRNAGRMDAFEARLDDATTMGAAWAKNMTRQRQEAMDLKDHADQAYDSGRYFLAKELYTEAIRIDEEDFHTNALLYANRAAALTNLGKNKDALEDCEHASEFAPKRLWLLVSTMIDDANTMIDDADGDGHLRLQTALGSCHTHGYEYHTLFSMHLATHRSLQVVYQALRLKPNYPEVLLRKADLLSRLGF